jgi:hypothetical protein
MWVKQMADYRVGNVFRVNVFDLLSDLDLDHLWKQQISSYALERRNKKQQKPKCCTNIAHARNARMHKSAQKSCGLTGIKQENAFSSDAECKLGSLVGKETCGDHGDDFDVTDA